MCLIIELKVQTANLHNLEMRLNKKLFFPKSHFNFNLRLVPKKTGRTNVMKTADLLTHFVIRYRPGPDDIRGAALARRGVVFLLRPLSAASPGASLPPSTGAHFLLQDLLAGRRPQQL